MLENSTPRVTKLAALCLVSAALLASPTRAQNAPCGFDNEALTYHGTPQEQAKCLLRPVLIGGVLGPQLKELPAPLDKLLDKPLKIGPALLRRFLAEHNIRETDLGGSLSDAVSRANETSQDSPLARYFVIHDVSTPNYLDERFPPDINEASWVWNDLPRKWLKTKVTHVYISRTGESLTAVDFKSLLPDPHHGTKFARDRLRNKGKGLYLHVELIQPRRRDPNGSPKNDRLAPAPGFTDAQLKRLALVYIAASVRRGQWLIPAFHASVDAGIADAHDDPQNFDTARWAKLLQAQLKAIKSSEQ
jgi:hypothetical protein